MLQQQNAFLQQQLEEANRKVDELLREVSELRELLVLKNQEEQKQQNIIKGLTKIQQNKSEKQTPSVAASKEPAPDSNDTQTTPEPKPREKTNYGAKRKEHYEVEVEEEDVYPADSRFDEMKARLIGTHDVVRYILVPMRFIKKVYHVHVYTQDGSIMEGRAPLAPLQGSNYDGSFIAGIAQLRYIYSMPVERIVKYFSENGFDMDKGTAHGLLRKTETIFENLYKAMGLAVKEDDYLAGDETYHRVLLASSGGLGSRKGYVWSVAGRRLIYVIYDEGSRRQEVITREMDTFRGTLQSDAYRAYRTLQGDGFPDITRIACLQHVKRKFRDAMDSDPAAGRIYALLNRLYHNEHMHRVGRDGWTVEDNLRWRQQYAPPILLEIQAELETQKVRADLTPKSPMAAAVGYLEDEWEAVCGIFSRGDTDLDNNLVERMQRYFAMSRHSSLFFGSHRGAERAAVIYTVALSAKMNGLDLYEYFLDIINTTAKWPPNTPLEKYRDLLPDRWKPRKSL